MTVTRSFPEGSPFAAVSDFVQAPVQVTGIRVAARIFDWNDTALRTPAYAVGGAASERPPVQVHLFVERLWATGYAWQCHALRRLPTPAVCA